MDKEVLLQSSLCPHCLVLSLACGCGVIKYIYMWSFHQFPGTEHVNPPILNADEMAPGRGGP